MSSDGKANSHGAGLHKRMAKMVKNFKGSASTKGAKDMEIQAKDVPNENKPTTAGQPNFGYQYGNGPIPQNGYGYGYYNAYPWNFPASYPHPNDMYYHQQYSHHPPYDPTYYAQHQSYFPQPPPGPRNTRLGDPDLCSIM
ncbi:hypothetical protein Tsubulata_013930 [Turnera subulata]|uniref:Uncharacterized protein n=1 Tax=Turnera subulata TaxID=218843 RepID=A0A9Q0FY50_9ROSI|nr:hypothetical protein Tsubulata_013930 [Turnera subulata]